MNESDDFSDSGMDSGFFTMMPFFAFDALDALDAFDAFDALDALDAFDAFDALDAFDAFDALDAFDAFDVLDALDAVSSPSLSPSDEVATLTTTTSWASCFRVFLQSDGRKEVPTGPGVRPGGPARCTEPAS